MIEGVVAIDNGGYSTCVATKSGSFSFPSKKGVYNPRSLESVQGNFDYVLEYEGRKYMMGTLADESKFPLQMHTESKANDFYDLSVYLALAMVGYDVNNIVVSVPISQHNESEKHDIITRLKGNKSIILNGKSVEIFIKDVRVAPETVSAFWWEKPKGKVRWIDWGSRTIGYGTTFYDGLDLKYSSKESGTFDKFGLDAKDLADYEEEALADYVGGKLLSLWDKDDIVIHLGGGVRRTNVIDRMSYYFKNGSISNDSDLSLVNGMYELGKGVFEID